jgi:uncharacterized membrane protein
MYATMKTMKKRVLFIAMCLYGIQVAHAQALFTGIGGGTYGWVSPSSVDADGSALVGGTQMYGLPAPYIWRREGGGWLHMPDQRIMGGAFGISYDGSTIVGWTLGSGNSMPDTASVWTNGGANQLDIKGLPGTDKSFADAISGDGQIIAGQRIDFDNVSHAFTWTHADGMRDLAEVPGSGDSVANSANADGSVIAGNVTDELNEYRGVIWRNGVPTALDDFDGRVPAVQALSGNGSVVVGESFAPYQGNQAYSFDGSLYRAVGGADSIAYGVNWDGSAIVGENPVGSQAFLWTESLGTVDLKEYLISIGTTSEGVNLSRFVYLSPRAMSPDGRTIAGIGSIWSGTSWVAGGWIVTNVPVPEPASIVALIIGAIAAVRPRSPGRREPH